MAKYKKSIRHFKKASKKRWKDEGWYGSKTLGPRTDAEFRSALSRGVKRLKSKRKNPATIQLHSFTGVIRRNGDGTVSVKGVNHGH